MIYKYLNRILDEAEREVIQEKNRIHWRNATSEDYTRISTAYAKLELISAISKDLFNILRLYS